MKRDFPWRPFWASTLACGAAALLGLAVAQENQSEQEDKAPPARPAAAKTDQPPGAEADEPGATARKNGDQPAREKRPAGREQENQNAEGQAAPANKSSPRRSGDAAEDPAGRRGQAGRNERGDEGQAGRAPRRAGLGLTIEAQGDAGLAVTSVEEGSIAAQSGLRVSDQIVSADGRRFRNPRQLQVYLSGQAGRRVPIIIERGGRQYTVQLTPRPTDDGAWLGVFMEDDEENQVGARVTHVYPTSPAARAGFRPGDVILQVNGQKVEGSPDVIALVEEQEPGSRAEFTVRRGDQEITLSASLGRRDAFVFAGRDPSSRQEGESDEDPFGDVPPYMMQLEHDRRMAEQHQRIEEALRDLQEEVKQLRAEIAKGK